MKRVYFIYEQEIILLGVKDEMKHLWITPCLMSAPDLLPKKEPRVTWFIINYQDET